MEDSRGFHSHVQGPGSGRTGKVTLQRDGMIGSQCTVPSKELSFLEETTHVKYEGGEKVAHN